MIEQPGRWATIQVDILQPVDQPLRQMWYGRVAAASQQAQGRGNPTIAATARNMIVCCP